MTATPPPSAYFSAPVSAICTPGFARAHRKVPYRVKDRIYNAAGLPRHHRQGWVIDHRLALEISGDNDPSNLYAQPIAEAHRKDVDENEAHAEVCSGRWSLAQARGYGIDGRDDCRIAISRKESNEHAPRCSPQLSSSVDASHIA